MPIKPLAIYTNYHTSDFFSLAVKPCKDQTKIVMKLMQGTVNTRELPGTYSILKKMLPSVLKSTCYNEDNYPFCKEVLHTEVGHLFEHILIEYICLLKVQHGYDNVEISGVTKWNWVLHPKGSFHITVSSGIDDFSFFNAAMQRTVALVNLILHSGQRIVAESPYQLQENNVKYYQYHMSQSEADQPLVENIQLDTFSE
jgi:hypothetical protein